MADYKYTVRQSVWGIHLPAVFALIPAARYRLGDESSVSPADLAAAAARAKAKAYFEEHYQIITAP